MEVDLMKEKMWNTLSVKNLMTNMMSLEGKRRNFVESQLDPKLYYKKKLRVKKMMMKMMRMLISPNTN